MREYGARNHISSFSDVCGLEDARFSRRQAFKLYATTSTYIITSSRHTRSGAQDRELEKTLCDNCVTLIPDSCETRSNQPPLLSTTCSTSSTYEKQGPRSACDAAMRSNQNNKNSQYEYRADKQYRSHTTVVPVYNSTVVQYTTTILLLQSVCRRLLLLL